MPINISAKILAVVHEHAISAYPNECCGALIGKTSGNTKIVKEARPLPNRAEKQTEREFLIDATDIHALEVECRKSGADILGFYHSHPDHPAIPSQTDLEAAFEVYSYVIVSVMNGVAVDTKSYLIETVDEAKSFHEEEMIVLIAGQHQ